LNKSYVEQIVPIKKRGVNQTSLISYNLIHIQEALKVCKKSKFSEVFKYIPISLVATMEAYFRSVVRLCVDRDISYMDKAIKIQSLKTNKFDFDVLKAIQGKVISGSELIAHLIKINNFNDINSIMSNLFEQDFCYELGKLKQSNCREKSKLLNTQRLQLKIFQEDSERIFKDIVGLLKTWFMKKLEISMINSNVCNGFVV
jgi:hypothetical protein